MLEKKQKMRKFWRCGWLENDWGPMGESYAWCKNNDCPHRECNCKTVCIMSCCPFFKKGDRSVILEVTEHDQDEMDAFKRAIEEDRVKKEIEERALYEHLKRKYEGKV